MNMQSVAGPTTSVGTGFGAIVAVALIGIGILFVTGHVQADALHTAAHDVRHATGFPCH